jgi:hypothetical protein
LDPVECLRKLIRTCIEYSMNQYAATKIAMESTDKLKGGQKSQCIRRQTDIYRIFSNQIKLVESQGRLKAVYPEVVNLIVIAMMAWLPKWYKKDGILKLDVIIEQMMDILFYGAIKSEGL